MQPSGESLGSDDLSSDHIYLRLEVDRELAFPDAVLDIQQALVLVLLLLDHGRVVYSDVLRIIALYRLKGYGCQIIELFC